MVLPTPVSSPGGRASDAVLVSFPGPSDLPTIFANPKSATFTRPLRSSRMFPGLMSRWTIPVVMSELERIANLRNNGQRLAGADATAGEQLLQIHAVHKLHDEEIQPIVPPAKIMNGDDAGVVELGQGFGFTGEPLGKRGVVSNPRAGGF